MQQSVDLFGSLLLFVSWEQSSIVRRNVWGYANTASVHCMRFFRQLKQHLKVSTASVQNVQDYANVLPIYSVVFRR